MDILLCNEAREAGSRLNPIQKYTVQKWGKKICLGREQRDNWSEPRPVYLFWCDQCNHFAKSGISDVRRLYCSYCDSCHRFVRPLKKPKEFFGDLRFLFKSSVLILILLKRKKKNIQAHAPKGAFFKLDFFSWLDNNCIYSKDSRHPSTSSGL